jgi:DNA polymerase-3 subunit delta'
MISGCQVITSRLQYPRANRWLVFSKNHLVRFANGAYMNWNMVGHDWAVQLLSKHVATGKFRQAYLFTGPQGIGKRTLALNFFKALNCQAPPQPGQMCNACHACTHIEQMAHPDLDLLQAEQDGGTLKVDQIRALQRNLSLTPYQARYRMALLLRFEEANQNAANALLKTLEEPSPQVVLILTAESAERLLPTIISRCEVLRTGPVPLPVVCENLQARWGLPAAEADLLAHLSGGRVGYALKLHANPEKLEQRQAWLDDLARLLLSGRVARFSYAENLVKDKEIARQVLQLWLSYWRDILLRTSGASAPFINLDRADEIEKISSRIDLPTAYQTVNAIQRTIANLENNVNARLAAEVLFLDLPALGHLT